MVSILLSLILVLAPTLRGGVSPCVFMSIYIIILSILLICISKLFVNSEIKIRKTPLDIAILLFFLVAMISSLNSKYIYGSAMEIVRFASLALIFYIVVNFITEKKDIKKMLNLILIAGTAIAIFGILQYFGVIEKFWWANPKFLSATYVNHNHFAGFLELLIPISIGMILSGHKTHKKVLYILSFLTLSIAFLLSMSRGGWFALSISMVFMMVVVLKKGRVRFIVFMAILFFITLIVFAFNAIDTSFLLRRISSYKELDFAGRLEIWKGTLGIIKNNFILGTAPGSFIYNFPKYRPIGLNMFVNFAHNDYLQIASEIGILGLGFLVFIIYRTIKKGLRTHMIARTSFKTWISLSLATGILSLAIHNIGDFNFYIPANAIMFTVFSGFIFNISSVKEGGYRYFVLRLNSMQRKTFKFIMLSVVSLTIVFMCIFIGAEIYSTASDRAISRNDLKSAETLVYRASRLNPFNYSYSYKLAGIYNKTVKALPEYKKALFLNPMDSWSWIALADTYYELFKASPTNSKLGELAASSYKKGLSLDPLNSYYLKKYADFLLNMNNPDLSSRVYKKASQVISRTKIFSSKPTEFTHGESYEDIADLAFFSYNVNKAIVFYKMAESLEEDNQGAKLGQVKCYMKMFLMKKALDKYREIKPSAKVKSILFASLGEYCFAKGLIGSTEKFLKRSMILEPKNPDGFQLRYKISKDIRGLDNSMKEFKDILDLNSIPVSIIGSRSLDIEVRLGIRGKLNKDGSIAQDIILPAGIYEFSIEAKGDKAQGIGPHIKVKFNGVDLMNIYIDSEDWGYYPGIMVVECSLNRIEIVYDNDYYNPETKEDRNLYIGSIKLKVL